MCAFERLDGEGARYLRLVAFRQRCGDVRDRLSISNRAGDGIVGARRAQLFQGWNRAARRHRRDRLAVIHVHDGNWIFTRPGRVVFETGEPFCFLTPVNYRALGRNLRARADRLDRGESRSRKADSAHDAELRQDVNKRLTDEEPETVRQAWQKWYFRGVTPDGEQAVTAPARQGGARDPAILAKGTLDRPPGGIACLRW